MFHAATLGDMQQLLQVSVAKSHSGSLERSQGPPASTMSITLNQNMIRKAGGAIVAQEFWLPGQTIARTISIESTGSVKITKARIELEGTISL